MLNLLLAISTILIFGLLYFYFKNKNYIDHLRTELNIKESELNLSLEVEEHLRDELINVQNQLQASIEDPVTNLLSWRLFEGRIRQYLKECDRYEFSMGILFVDIDDFKVINDALGYEKGNTILEAVARRLETAIRQVDSLSRFSKDTFVILVGQLVKPETAAIVAQRILQAFKEPIQIPDYEFALTVSIGIAIYPLDGENPQELFRSAEHALHLAKEGGKNSYKFYQESLHTRSIRELALHTRLSSDLVFQEFSVFYEPIMDVSLETIFCMDAILRWQHNQLGLIPIDELYKNATKQRRLNVLSEWLIKKACRQFLDWQALGFAPNYLGIQISFNQLENSHFIYSISQILQELSFNPERLLISLWNDGSHAPFTEATEKAFNMLRYMKTKIAINNFGADQSFPLLNLTNFNLNYLKITPLIISNLNKNPKSLALAESILNLSKKISLEVIVLGIETEEQMQTLKNMGYKYMQGKLFSPPLSEEDVVRKMALES